MSYCHKCGKKTIENDSFCSLCGAKIREVLEDIGEEIKEKTSYKGLVIFIIFLIIVGYIILDLWAISQLTPVISAGSIFTTISNSNVDTSLSKTHASSTLRLENPTFVPIIAKVVYDANYGDTKIADGKTKLFFIKPNSEEDIPADLTIYHLSTAKSGLKWIWDTITGKQERKYINIYADIGITKVKLGTLE